MTPNTTEASSLMTTDSVIGHDGHHRTRSEHTLSQRTGSTEVNILYTLTTGDVEVECLRIIALYAACLPLLGCGGYYFVGFVSNPGGHATITGTVIAVSSGFVSDLQGITPTTTVAFENSGIAVTLIFCGDQQSLFPLNTAVRADYTVGVVCSVLARVVVMSETTDSQDKDESYLFDLIVLPLQESEHNLA